MRKHLAWRYKMDQAANGVGLFSLKGALGSIGYNLGYMIEGTCNCNIQLNTHTGDFTPVEQAYMEADRLCNNLFKE